MVMPVYSTKNAAGGDLRADLSKVWNGPYPIEPGECESIPTGLTGEELFSNQPDSVCGLIFPRSGIAAKHRVTVLNSPGLIDYDYRDEISVLLINHGKETYWINHGDRIAQLVMIKRHWHLGFEVAEAERVGGFGSTGLE
jgi:dUTP pyrophosphatase